jgi:hypothetical protein
LTPALGLYAISFFEKIVDIEPSVGSGGGTILNAFPEARRHGTKTTSGLMMTVEVAMIFRLLLN